MNFNLSLHCLRFFLSTGNPQRYLFFAALMPCSRQQLAMFMFAHFLLSFFNDTAQRITSQIMNVKIN